MYMYVYACEYRKGKGKYLSMYTGMCTHVQVVSPKIKCISFCELQSKKFKHNFSGETPPHKHSETFTGMFTETFFITMSNGK